MASNVRQLLKKGDCFVYDTEGVEGGDLLYGEVLEVHQSFGHLTDSVGRSSGGYTVRVYCSQEPPVDDHYGRDFADGQFILLSREQIERARKAGWPQEAAFLRELGVA